MFLEYKINIPKQKRILIQSLLGLYFCALLFCVWTSLTIVDGRVIINWEKYEELKQINFQINYTLNDFIINFLMLLPVGFYLKQTKCSRLLIWGAGMLLGFVIEFGQFVLPIYRVVQLMDVVTNGFSAVLGCLISENIYKPLKNTSYYDKITK